MLKKHLRLGQATELCTGRPDPKLIIFSCAFSALCGPPHSVTGKASSSKVFCPKRSLLLKEERVPWAASGRNGARHWVRLGTAVCSSKSHPAALHRTLTQAAPPHGCVRLSVQRLEANSSSKTSLDNTVGKGAKGSEDAKEEMPNQVETGGSGVGVTCRLGGSS